MSVFTHDCGIGTERDRAASEGIPSEGIPSGDQRGNPQRGRAGGRKIDDAGAVLKYVPSAGFQPSSVFQRQAEGRAPRAQRQVNPELTGLFRSFPDAWMNNSTRPDQCAIHIDTNQPNR